MAREIEEHHSSEGQRALKYVEEQRTSVLAALEEELTVMPPSGAEGAKAVDLIVLTNGIAAVRVKGAGAAVETKHTALITKMVKKPFTDARTEKMELLKVLNAADKHAGKKAPPPPTQTAQAPATAYAIATAVASELDKRRSPSERTNGVSLAEAAAGATLSKKARKRARSAGSAGGGASSGDGGGAAAAARTLGVAGTDGRTFPKVTCHNCQKVGHFKDMCPDG